MSAAVITERVAEFENICFKYEEIVEPQKIDNDHYVVVYSNNTITDNRNVEQISISYQMFYENNNGTTPANILNSNGTERLYIAEYANITFMYNEKVVQTISETQYVNVYNDITIISSDNSNFKKGDEIEQISVSIEFFLENSDGSKYIN